MTDITKLAQRMKAAAEKASNGDWVKESGDGWEACCSANDQANGGFIIAHFEGPDAVENRQFVQAANPANVLALVEALEKAQRANAAQDDHINQQQDRIDQLEKGHQEAAKQINSWRRMAKQNIAEREKDIAELDAARQRIAELESRTVKLPDDEDGQAYGFGKWANRKLPATAGTMTIAYCEDAWRAAFEVFSSAAGIKVEAE
ncbi:TPA: ead/Ea22-like family protein [Klebsiella variicola subsp. variicola]|nr:ead/Ea22-like family protein [Klebsiella variicola subsp. variicola]